MYRRLSQIVMKNLSPGLFFQWRAPKEDREIDFTECVFHLNLFHCPSFGKAQNLSCVHARGGWIPKC